MLKSIFAEVEASLEENKKASEPPVPNPRSEIKEERRERRRRRSSTSKIPHVVKSSRQEDNSAIEFMLDEFAQRGRFVNRHAEDKENEQVIPAVSETTAPDTRIRRKYVLCSVEPTNLFVEGKKCVKNQKPVSSAPCLMAPLKR